MTFLTSLLPGLREVRAPLAGGYLWLLLIWLVVDPERPEAEEGGFYGRLEEVANALPPVGQAIAVSIAAYLIGSLLTSLFLRLARDVNEWWSVPREWARGPRAEDSWDGNEVLYHGEGQEPTILKTNLQTLISLTGIESEYPIGHYDEALLRSIEEMMNRELGEAQRELQSAIRQANEASDGHAFFRMAVRGDDQFMQILATDENKGTVFARHEVQIPHFSITRDLFREFPILRTRLVEHAETTGTEVERIHAEAEFRFAVAAPLLGLIILFATTNLLWVIALALPLALIAQGFSLERQGNRQLVDALRTRSGTEELGQITPVFTRYRAQARNLIEALLSAHWDIGRSL